MTDKNFLIVSSVLSTIFWIPCIIVLINRLLLNKTKYAINVLATTLILIMTLIFIALSLALILTPNSLSGHSTFYLLFLIVPAYLHLYSILIIDKSSDTRMSLAKFINILRKKK